MLSTQLTEKALAEVEMETEKNERTEEGTVGDSQKYKSPSKARSLSDVAAPSLSPSPKFREPEKRKSRDDSTLNHTSPTTPRRPAFPARGLSLQMPPRDLMSTNSVHVHRVPLSPQLDHSQSYGSPTSVLPRRSRGLDFSRAATNLHHSTLAEQSSPDSSPTIGGRAMNIPSRKNPSHYSESHNMNASLLWSTAANQDRTHMSGSLGSVNMMGSDSSSASSDEDEMMDADDIDDSILTTPQVNKTTVPFGSMACPSPGNQWANGNSAAVSSLMNFQRARLRHGKGRKSSSSGSGNSMASPSSKSPPGTRTLDGLGNGYFGRDLQGESLRARRESISWAANQLHISGSESDDGTLKSTLETGDPITPGRDQQRGVIRRPVTRRGNMLPKTKGFARIRAALAEEGAPVETEVRREAEVVRQTRESDLDLEVRHASMSTMHSSPNLGPVQHDSLEGIPEDAIMDDGSVAMLSSSFKQHAMRNSRGKEFWETFTDERHRTPPPPSAPPHRSSSGISDDISVFDCTPPSSLIFPPHTTASSSERQSSPSRSATPQPTAAEITQKMNKKRRRDDDFDPSSFKRRAVSPGMSVHNSPITQSPMQRDVTPWGSRPPSNGEAGKVNNSGMKRVGYQGMVDTNDGLMKMSIE